MLEIRFLFGCYKTEWYNSDLLDCKMCEILARYYINKYKYYNVEYRTAQ